MLCSCNLSENKGFILQFGDTTGEWRLTSLLIQYCYLEARNTHRKNIYFGCNSLLPPSPSPISFYCMRFALNVDCVEQTFLQLKHLGLNNKMHCLKSRRCFSEGVLKCYFSSVNPQYMLHMQVIRPCGKFNTHSIVLVSLGVAARSSWPLSRCNKTLHKL